MSKVRTIIAAVLLTAVMASTPVLADTLLDTSLAPTAAACGTQGGSGDC